MNKCNEERFLKDVENHTMDVLQDDENMRHLIFTENGSSFYRFDLITWPGYLCITGDCGTYVFRRLLDMFDFFRSKDGELNINPGYWGEKLESIDTHGGFEKYESDVFDRTIKEDFDEWEFEEDTDKGLSAEEVKAAVWKQIKSEVLYWSEDGEHPARQAASSFKSDYGHEFVDFWERDLTEYTFRFIWCLRAIVWGIQKYDTRKLDKAP
ncbi:hypothetical protein HBA55_35040 [Pseudomaricurvus alkylphenolicus]|uniref:hypothetical protein n=1 Tax=Pseudomaricurvus alkylphenolicus TaxID=1306991 RepID=UPI00141F6117|nr:hypothetical protein [Pseudomaricurvus alkylphenolicus]NIB44850.1 hypothetical protein [Pseudomaricurvus alkylphenolicus]